MKLITIAISIFFLVAIAALLLASNYLVDYAIQRQEIFNTEMDSSYEAVKATDQIKKAFEEYSDDYFSNADTARCEIYSSDGIKLVGNMYCNDSDYYVLMVHCYMGCREDMKKSASIFHEWGFNVLTPDNRAHWESEGDFIGMGWLDAQDMLGWINLTIEQNQNVRIVLYGISMGVATVMNLSGMDLPNNVIAIIEDCGYSSVWQIFSDELKAIFNLLSFPMLNIADLIGQIQAGYSFSDASSVSMIAKSTLPMMFIHGKDDSFVGYYMLNEIIGAKTVGEMHVLRVVGAGHAESNLVNPVLYYTSIKDFLSRNV